LLVKAGYRAACLVEHEHFVEFSDNERAELEKAIGLGGFAEGFVLFTGAEGRSQSTWGEHITFIRNTPELLIATHPNTLQGDGIDQIAAHRYKHSHTCELHFIRVSWWPQ